MKDKKTTEFIDLKTQLLTGKLSDQEIFELPILLAERNELAKKKWESLNKKLYNIRKISIGVIICLYLRWKEISLFILKMLI